MKTIALTIFYTAILATGASAACYGTDSFQTCYDDNGSTYSVNRLGNSTYVDGYNANTGTRWNQNTTTYGNQTMHNGTVNGQSWYMNQYSGSGMQMYSGQNAAGDPFSYTCDSFGNCY